MVRLVTIVTPKNHSFEVLNVLLPLDNQQLYQLTSIYTNDNVQITFKTKDDELLKVLEKLNDTECGINWGHIDVVELLLSRPALPNADDTNKENNRKSLKIRERMTIDEIASLINDGNQLSFNFVTLLALASIIAGTGLLMNSATTVIASMLVSPLMGPILSITFGLAVQGKESIQSGFKNVSIGIIICLVTGILMGLVASFIYSSNYRSDEMFSRGEPLNLIGGFIVAISSGAAVVVGITMGGINALVGTAISASLLPPIVNSGLCLTMALKYRYVDRMTENSIKYSSAGGISFCLFIVNFFSIVAIGFLTFRYVKGLHSKTGV